MNIIFLLKKVSFTQLTSLIRLDSLNIFIFSSHIRMRLGVELINFTLSFLALKLLHLEYFLRGILLSLAHFYCSLIDATGSFYGWRMKN